MDDTYGQPAPQPAQPHDEFMAEVEASFARANLHCSEAELGHDQGPDFDCENEAPPEVAPYDVPGGGGLSSLTDAPSPGLTEPPGTDSHGKLAERIAANAAKWIAAKAESDAIIAAGVSAAKVVLEERAAAERTRAQQPARLAAAKFAADQARECAVAAEPWADTVSVLPAHDQSGELAGMVAFPDIEAKEIWGLRLLFDLIGCSDNNADDIDSVLDRYYTLLNGDISHLFLIFSAALVTAVDTVIPMLLNNIEESGDNWEARVLLADAARKAWSLNVNAPKGAPGS